MVLFVSTKSSFGFKFINSKKQTMKKITLTVLAIAAFGIASAQDMKYGIKGGIDMVSAKSELGSYNASGFYFGGFAEFEMSDKIVLQPGLNYHTASKDGVKFDYVSIPAIAKYNLSDKLNLLAGPTLYYSMDSADTEKTRFNLGIGASYDITDQFFVEPRYDMGLTGDLKVNHFLIGTGYKF
jgi:opacity protein-like surface antigen